MKRILFLIVLNIFFTRTFPQEAVKPVYLTLKAGYTAANMYGRDTERSTFLNGDPDNFYVNNPAGRRMKSGLSLGATLEKKVGNRASLGLEVMYMPKGTGIKVTKHWNSDAQVYEEVEGRIHWDQHYITFAVPVAVYFAHGPNEFYVRGGLFLDKLLSTKEHGKIKTGGETYHYENDRDANNFEPGFFTGFGYVFKLPDHAGSLVFEFDWSRCILFSAGSGMIPNPQHYYNQTVGLRVGYRW